jgi:sterol desaturase/sphingolipid hydroxylase (fatty acid hydroxylase superfamily)
LTSGAGRDPHAVPGGNRARFTAAGAAVVFVVTALYQPDVALALVILGALFIPLERLRPVHRQPIRRQGLATDAVHFVADEAIAAIGVAIGLIFLLPMLVGLVAPVRALVESQSSLARWIEALVIGELAGYWGHRAQHELPWLWRFHRVHHSSPTLDWLAPNRRHPVDLVGSRLAVGLPLLALGFTVPTIAAHYAVKRAQGLFVHANIKVSLGPLRWLIASPEFHHWHHVDDPALYHNNFAGQLPLVDWVFGTLHMPKGQWPERYGVDGDMPETYLAQLAVPFRRSDRSRVHSVPYRPSVGPTVPMLPVLWC